jgi:tetratricopeptide (TPR) repeat protein
LESYQKVNEQQPHHQIQNQGPVQGQIGVNYGPVTMHFDGSSTIPVPPKQVWNIPYLRNDYFTGREEILEQLHTRFKANNATALSQRTALSGLGGIGKTQIAVQYAYQHSDEYQAVLWARAESHEALTSSFVEIAGHLDLPQKDEKDQTIIVQAVKRWLQDNSGWLLILDNADEPKVVREFLPTKCDGHMLLTTRAQALGGLAQRIEVDTFTPELGALFLLRRAALIAADGALDDALQSDREVALQISEELGGLPLALDQAGAYIEETQCCLSDYLSLYRTRRAEVLKERGGLFDDHPDSVATTWALSFDRVNEQSAVAADLLRLCAFLAPDAIPEEIITAGAENLGPVLQAVANDPLALNKAIAALGAYSLIRRDSAEKTLSIHRLVQAVLRDAISAEETKVWVERTVLTVSEACPAVEFAMWPQWERFLPHALVCADLAEREHVNSREVGYLLYRMASYLHARGRYEERVEELYQLTLVIWEQQLGPEDLLVACVLNDLANLYQERGNEYEAEKCYKHALNICEWQLKYHSDSKYTLLNKAISHNNLAILYFEREENDKEAMSHYHETLIICEQQLEPEEILVAYVQHNLANLHREMREYDKAEGLYLEASQILSKQSRERRYEVAHQHYGLAELCRAQGNYQQAKERYEEALKIWQEQLGPEHPLVAHPLNGLAELYRAQGNYQQAEECYKGALTIWQKQLGSEHPQEASSLNGLAEIYQAQKIYEQAEECYREALSILKRHLTLRHPFTQMMLNNYVSLLWTIGRNNEAKELEEHSQPRFSEGGNSRHEGCSPTLRCVVSTPLRGSSRIPS